MPCSACQPPGCRRTVIVSSRMSRAPCSCASRSAARMNSGSPGSRMWPRIGSSRMATVGAVRLHQLLEMGDVVEAHEVAHAGERLGDAHRDNAGAVRVSLVGAAQGDLVPATVVAVGGHDDVVAAGERARPSHGHHDRLGGRVGEAHEVDRGRPRAEPLGELTLQGDRRGHGRGQTVGCRARHGLDDARMRVAVDQGGVVVDQVDVGVAVDVPEAAALAPLDADRERIVMGHRPRVGAGHHLRQPLEELA